MLISKAADTIEAAGDTEEGSDFKGMKQFQNDDVFQKRGGVVKEAIGLPKICRGGQEQGFAE